MGKLVLFLHISLDGFATGPQGEMDWIIVNQEIFDFAAHRTDSATIALYGRKTFEMMEAYWPTAGDQPDASKHDREHSRWYNQVKKVVLSRTGNIALGPGISVISDNLVEKINQVKNSTSQEIIIFGSPGAAHSLMADNLIDEFWLFVNPVLVGQGIPVFKNIHTRANLRLVNSHAFSSGVVCLHYALVTP